MISAAIALSLPGYAFAQSAPRTDARPAALEHWVDDIDAQLSGAMEPIPFQDESNHGEARVMFYRGADGAATNASLYESSGNPRLDVDALNAVKRLHHIRPFPAGVSPNRPILATLVYDTDPQSEDYLHAMRRAAHAEVIVEEEIEKGTAP